MEGRAMISEYPGYESYEQMIRHADHHGGGCDLDYDGCNEIVGIIDALRLQVSMLRDACDQSMRVYESMDYPHDSCDCDDCNAARATKSALEATATSDKI